MNKFSIEFVKKNIPNTFSPFSNFTWVVLIEFSSIESNGNEKEKYKIY